MKRTTILCALLAMCLASGGPAFAEREENQRPGQRQGQGQHPQQERGQHGPPQQARHDNSRQDERGAGPDHRFRRGDRLPPEYHNRNYVVDDWHDHHLSAPPRGYHWVQVGGDYVLVAIATGIIVQLLLNH